MLNISFLGKITFEFNGDNISEQIGSKAAALVALLMLHKGKDLLREKIITYLWPDSNEDAAKYNLRYNLWQLKKNIRKDSNNQDFIKINKDYCSINMSYEFDCDVLKVLSFKKDNSDTIESLTKLKGLFNGDFFEGHYFNNCHELNELIIFYRNYFESCKVRILKRLSELLEQNSDYETCIDIISLILKIEPYDETLAAKVIQLHTINQNRGAAIRFYKRFCSRLTYSLGIEPSIELQQQYNELKKSLSETGKPATNYKVSNNETDCDNKISVITDCIESVKFFWLTDCVEKICNLKSIDIQDFLSPSDIYAISFIVPDLEANIYKETLPINIVPDVRITKAFIHLIQSICEDYILTVAIHNFSSMDKMSLDVLQYLYNQDIKNFIIIK